MIFKNPKHTLVLVVALLAIWALKHFLPKAKKDEFVFDNIHIPKKTCISSIHALLGNGIDSLKACDCLVPKLYELVKGNDSLLEEFKMADGLFILNNAKADSASEILIQCVKANIIHPDSPMKLMDGNRTLLKNRIKATALKEPALKTLNIEAFSECLTEKMSNAKINIGEYFVDDYASVPHFKEMMVDCMARHLHQ